MSRKTRIASTSISRRGYLKASVGVTAGLAGCGGSNSDTSNGSSAGSTGDTTQISFRCMSMPNTESFLEKHTQRFEEETDIAVEYEILGWDFQAQSTDISTQSGPDVEESPGGWFLQQIEGWDTLDEYVGNSDYPNIDPDKWFDATTQYTQYQAPNDSEKNNYLIPWWHGARGFPAYKPMLEEAGVPERPKDWGEMIEYGKIFRENMDAHYTAFPWGGLSFPQSFPTLTWSNGGQLISDDKSEWVFNSEEAVDAFDFWINHITKHDLTPDDVVEWDTSAYDNAFADRIATGLRFPGVINKATKREGISREDFELWNVPSGRKSGAEPVTYTGQESIGIHPWAKNKDACAKWIDYLLRPEVQAEYTKPIGYLPAVLETTEKFDPFKSDHIWKQYVELTQSSARATPLVQGYRRTRSLLPSRLTDAAVKAISSGSWATSDSQRVLDNLVSEANGFLQG